MANGKKTGGRKKGSTNKINDEIRRAAIETGELPLQYMLRVMRDPKAEIARRDRMAESASSYLHPRLSAVAHGGATGGPIRHVHDLSRLSGPELDALEGIIGKVAGPLGDQDGEDQAKP